MKWTTITQERGFYKVKCVIKSGFYKELRYSRDEKK